MRLAPPLPSAGTSSRVHGRIGIMSRHSPHARSCHENCDALFPPAPETVRTHPSRLAALVVFRSLRVFVATQKTPSQRASKHWKKLFQCSESGTGFQPVCAASFPMSGNLRMNFSRPWNETFHRKVSVLSFNLFVDQKGVRPKAPIKIGGE